MDNTTSDDLPMLKAVVEDYIYVMTGKKIKVIFDEPMQMRRHFQMLCAAYDMIRVQQNNK
jgi:hypothetical protein